MHFQRMNSTSSRRNTSPPLSGGALLVTYGRMVAAEWRRLVADISRVFASNRRHRDAIERELFHGRYRLCSKNDDELPIV